MQRQTKRYASLVVFVLLGVALTGCLDFEDEQCLVPELGYTHTGGNNHPNEKDALDGGHVQHAWDQDVGIQLHSGPLCAYPFKEEWHTARFDEDGRFEEQEGLNLASVGSYQVWGTMVKDGNVLAGGDPVQDALMAQVYFRSLYIFPDVTHPIEIEVPIVCCHHYDSSIYVNQANAVDELVYFVTVSSKETGEVFDSGNAPFHFKGEELTEWLGPRYEVTLIIELTSPQPEAPPPTLGHWFVVEINVPDGSWPESAPEPRPESTARSS